VRDKDLRKALLMGVDFSMTGRNKVAWRPFPAKSAEVPETPANGLILAYVIAPCVNQALRQMAIGQ